MKCNPVKKAAVCIAAALSVMIASFGAFAAEMKWTYDEAAKTVSVKGYGMINDAAELTKYLNDAKIIDVQRGVTKIDRNVFSSLGNIEEVKLPEGLISIGDNSFNLSSELKTVVFPKTLETIGAEAFMGCGSLTNVTIPENVSSIGVNAFANCVSVNEFNVSNDNESFTAVDGVIFTKDKKELVMYPAGKEDEEYLIPDGTEKIREKAFAYNENLKKAVIPESVNEIGNYAFYCCNDLKNVDFKTDRQNGTKSVGNYAFYGCRMKSVFIPFGTETIGDGAFKNCDALTYADIPRTVKSIGTDAFYGVGDSIKISGFGSFLRSFAEENNIPFLESVRVMIGEKEIRFDCAATVRNGCTMVPMRKIFEELGAEVSWNGETQTASGAKNGDICTVTIGDNMIYKNGLGKELSAPAVIENGRTLVHARAIAEVFGAEVLWNGEKGLVTIRIG